MIRRHMFMSALVATVALSGCGGGKGSSATPTPTGTPTPTPTASPTYAAFPLAGPAEPPPLTARVVRATRIASKRIETNPRAFLPIARVLASSRPRVLGQRPVGLSIG